MDLKDKFLKASSELVSPQGFVEENNNKPRFLYNAGSIIKILTFDIDTRALRFNIKPQLLLRHNDISNLRKGFISLPHKGDHYYTVITQQYSLAELYERPEFKILGYIIKDEDTLQKSIISFKSFMTEIGFAFFDRFKTLADFDKWFNEPVLNGTYDFKRGNILNFAVEGLVAAKLNKNPNYDQLYDIWMRSISPDFTEALQIVKSLKEYLDKYPLES